MTETPEIGAEIRPLAWLLGRWRGWGVWSGFGVTDQVLIHDLRVTHDGGPYVCAASTLYSASSATGNVSADDDVAAGLDLLEVADVWSTETLYLRVPPGGAGDGGGPFAVEGMLADPAGFVATLTGRCAPNTMEVESAHVGSTPSGAPVTEIARRYLVRDGVLMWTASMAAFGADLARYLTVRLAPAKEDRDA